MGFELPHVANAWVDVVKVWADVVLLEVDKSASSPSCSLIVCRRPYCLGRENVLCKFWFVMKICGYVFFL